MEHVNKHYLGLYGNWLFKVKINLVFKKLWLDYCKFLPTRVFQAKYMWIVILIFIANFNETIIQPS